MPIQTECGNCGRSYTVKDDLAGRKFRCRDCQATVVVPESGTADTTPESAPGLPPPPPSTSPSSEKRRNVPDGDQPRTARSKPKTPRSPDSQRSAAKPAPRQKKRQATAQTGRAAARPKKSRPQPRENDFDDVEFEEFDEFESLGDEDFESFGDDDFDAFEPVHKPRSKPSKKSRKKKRRKKKSSGAGLLLLKIGGGVVAVMVLLGCLGVVGVAIQRSGGLSGFSVSWKSYTTPDGGVTVLMPGTPKQLPRSAITNPAPGASAYGVTKSQYACVVVVEPLPPQLASIDKNQLIAAVQNNPFASLASGAKNLETTSIDGTPGFTYEETLPTGAKSLNVALFKEQTAYTIKYLYKGSSPGSNKDKFLNSIQVN